MMECQAYNTALYDAIDPSILFNGAYETVDRLQRKEFANGDLRDGIASLPDEPLTSKVVLIRFYLVDACNTNHDETKTVQGLVRLVTKRGCELGLPAGSVLDELAAPVIEKDKRDKKDDGKNKGKKPGDAAFKLIQTGCKV
ncbi:hypothetical protein Ctob_015162 [Chrysochromulina tobinii]|uniref:Uncharacterized protein n=1 Tax=Chrysochromulina tobinii TaxID=1460289 RepID=A0A0M0JZA1_9EUKA|nr:hypothetical protein Ctob_015162 [Chrysochromulina tobinii]|eukprot:KOO31662.1 hypothetical protein Ctob_015162 [Chrysochromulina sp. CCMP291]